MQSQQNNLNNQEFGKWLGNTLKFSTPTLLAFLLALHPNGRDLFPDRGQLLIALGAGYSALLSSAIDLLTKYRQGV